MSTIPAPSVSLSQAGRAAHDLGLAGLLGGNLFGRLALHPSVTAISDQSERGKVVNAAWRRYGIVNTISLLAVGTGWLGARANEAADRRLSPQERRLARAKDVLVGVVGRHRSGLGACRACASRPWRPSGAVALRDGDHVAAGAGDDARRVKRRLNALGTASLAAEAAPRRRERRAEPAQLPPPAGTAPAAARRPRLSPRSATAPLPRGR